MSETLEDRILAEIDQDTGYTVDEFAGMFDVHWKDVRSALANLMDRGLITSTPEWRYRLARRTNYPDDVPVN